ncbi:Uncharacterized protein YpmS [Alteribacillus persepolensis]|uniref:Uncharacterized protein YpmS n=2 Tax=Alteribacillus persepolensis TaxID=568899 RepID=A0A1G8DDW7_9BACI|nr:Uncharacterized protein YpmS [Alteribacillus persepolensis]
MENNRHTNEEESFEEYLSIHMTSSQLEKLLNDELEGMDASIYDNHIRISSSYQLLGRTIQIFMDFVPEIHNGNIVLNETGFTAGNLPLSGSRVLSLMQQQSSLPSYIEIQSSRSRVLIHLDELSIADTYEVKAEMFNLEDDKITFLLGKTESQ